MTMSYLKISATKLINALILCTLIFSLTSSSTVSKKQLGFNFYEDPSLTLSVDLTKLICNINSWRGERATENTLPLGVHNSLLGAAKERGELVSLNQTQKEASLSYINTNFTSIISRHNYRWLAAAEILVKGVYEPDNLFSILINDKGSRSILRDSNYTHFGGYYKPSQKHYTLIFGRGIYTSVLPDCAKVQNNKENSLAKLKARLSKMNSNQIAPTEPLVITINATPNNATFLPHAISDSREAILPVTVNATKPSRASRLRRKLRQTPMIRWTNMRSGSSVNGNFDYSTVSSTFGYRFDLVKLVCLVNYVRKKSQPPAPPLGANLILMEVARNHTELMATYNHLDHFGVQNSSVGERILDAGYEWNAYGQNVARNIASEEMFLKAMLMSRGHREKLLGQGFGSLGAWYVPKGNYWTLLLASSNHGKDQPPAKCPDDFNPAFLEQYM